MGEETTWQVVNLTKIGNSYGIILTRKMLKHMKIQETATQVGILLKDDGTLGIKSANKIIPLNLDLSTWDAQFKAAFAKGHLPEPCLWDHTLTEEEEEDWTWPDEYDEKGNLISSDKSTTSKKLKKRKK